MPSKGWLGEELLQTHTHNSNLFFRQTPLTCTTRICKLSCDHNDQGFAIQSCSFARAPSCPPVGVPWTPDSIILRLLKLIERSKREFETLHRHRRKFGYHCLGTNWTENRSILQSSAEFFWKASSWYHSPINCFKATATYSKGVDIAFINQFYTTFDLFEIIKRACTVPTFIFSAGQPWVDPRKYWSHGTRWQIELLRNLLSSPWLESEVCVPYSNRSSAVGHSRRESEYHQTS